MIDPASIQHECRLGDCLGPEGLALLPDKSVDHAILDPPYEAEAHSKGRRQATAWRGGKDGRAPALKVKAIPYPPITGEQRAAVGREIPRVTRGWALVFCQAEALHLWRASLEGGGARHVRMGVYRKLDAQPQYSGDRPGVGWEAIEIVWCGNERPRWNRGGRVAVWEASREFRLGPGGVAKQAPVDGAKPLDLMEQLVGDFTARGALVCDPFAGSGTTGVACKRLGRRFIGWEIKPEYHAIAAKRIAEAHEQFRLPLAKEKARQLGLDGTGT